MISETLKKLITPSVDPSVKLTGVGLFLGKLLDKFEDRVTSLESRQLQKGDKGDRGETGQSVTLEQVKPVILDAHRKHLKEQTEDLREITARTWRSW